MACGSCGQKAAARAAAVQAAQQQQTTMEYDLVAADGKVIGSYTNIVLARVEARRSGGTLVPRTVAASS